MTNLLWLWFLNRFAFFCETICQNCFIIAAISLVLIFISTMVYSVNKDDLPDQVIYFPSFIKFFKWVLCVCLVAGVLSSFFRSFKLNDTEFKTAAVVIIAKDIVESKQAEKVIDILDKKLDEWSGRIDKGIEEKKK